MRMLKKLLLCWCVIAIACLGAVAARADLIIDTGGVEGAFNGGYQLSAGQRHAGQFSLSQDTIITQVQGLIGYSPGQSDGGGGTFMGGDINAVIRSDAGGLPGAVLQSQTFTSINPYLNTWQGPSGLNWTLQSNTYWLAFEVDSSSSFAGCMYDPPFTPLPLYASTLNGGAYRVTGQNVCMRVYGDPIPGPVPLPGAVLLLGAGLGRLAIYRRRKLTATV
jgi:hypothetical protein